MFSSFRYLEKLEERANQNPNDPNLQVKFLSELNRNNPSLVIQREESGYFASNEKTKKEYLKALVATNKIDSYSLNSIFDMSEQSNMNFMPTHGIHQTPMGAMAMPTSSIQQSPELPQQNTPVQVEIVEGSFKTQLLKALRTLMAIFLLYQVISYFSQDFLSGKASIFKEFEPEYHTDKTFDDVKGAVEAKEELQEIVEYLTHPERFTRLGGKLPKGVLLTGPPGTGKTLLAKAIAGEANVPFFYASGSEFEEMYVGVGAKRVRELFKAAKQNSPCIIFIDEIDAVGSTRHLKEQQALKMTLNQLLVEIDGFREAEGVIVIGATNLPQALDPALVRAGRFDRNVVVPLPDVQARQEILAHYLEKVPHYERIDYMRLARGCPGLSGADLANMVNMAAIRASTKNRAAIDVADLEYAKDKILMGNARHSAVIPEVVRKVTAWHESGHALVAFFTEGALPLHKATLLPRGPALGMVVQLPEEKDLIQRTKKQMIAEIDVCLGGRVAEELIFGEENITSGASSDIERATKVARNMVKAFGMSSKIGLIYYDKENNANSKEVDEEVRKMLNESYARVKKLLSRKRRQLGYLANNLIEYETLTNKEIEHVIQGKDLKLLRKEEKKEIRKDNQDKISPQLKTTDKADLVFSHQQQQ